MSDGVTVIIPGMTRLEQLELENALGESVEFR